LTVLVTVDHNSPTPPFEQLRPRCAELLVEPAKAIEYVTAAFDGRSPA
jgi:hypothetical protein